MLNNANCLRLLLVQSILHLCRYYRSHRPPSSCHHHQNLSNGTHSLPKDDKAQGYQCHHYRIVYSAPTTERMAAGALPSQTLTSLTNVTMETARLECQFYRLVQRHYKD